MIYFVDKQRVRSLKSVAVRYGFVLHVPIIPSRDREGAGHQRGKFHFDNRLPDGRGSVRVVIFDGADGFIDYGGFSNGFDADVFAHLAAIAELDDAADLGEQRVVLAPADIVAGLDLGAALPHDNRAARNQLATEDLHTEPLRIRVAPVFGTA